MENENEAAGEINTIEATPGFILPDADGKLLRDFNRPEYDRLAKKRDGLYQRSADFQNEHPTEMPEAAQSNVAQLQEQSELISQAKDDMKKLVEFGFEDAEIPLDIENWKAEDLHLQRLDAEKDYTTLTPKIAEQLKTLEILPSSQEMFGNFVNTNDPKVDDKYVEEIMTATVGWVHRLNKQKHEFEK